MQIRRWVLTVAAMTDTLCFICGCNNVNPNQGFTVTTNERIINRAGGLPGPAAPLPLMMISGQWRHKVAHHLEAT